MADKILVISALICFVSLDLINPWWVLVIVAREFLVTSLRLVAADEGVVIAANKWGKRQNGKPDCCNRIDFGDAVCAGIGGHGRAFRFYNGRVAKLGNFPGPATG